MTSTKVITCDIIKLNKATKTTGGIQIIANDDILLRAKELGNNVATFGNEIPYKSPFTPTGLTSTTPIVQGLSATYGSYIWGFASSLRKLKLDPVALPTVSDNDFQEIVAKTYKWISDPAAGFFQGFIAEDIQESALCTTYPNFATYINGSLNFYDQTAMLAFIWNKISDLITRVKILETP